MNRFVVIGGPTASGKSALAMKIAREFDGEIINGDSVAMYRRFDIGTAKPSIQERNLIPHHLIDILEPEDELDAARYGDLALEKIAELQKINKLPIVVGGSGLYLRALMRENFHDLPHSPDLRLELSKLTTEELVLKLQAVDPERAKKIHKNDHFRLARALEIFTLTGKTMSELTNVPSETTGQDAFIINLNPERNLLHHRIAVRTEKMLADGLVDEVRELLSTDVLPTAKPFSTIGYKQALNHLEGLIPLESLQDQIIFATRQLAKRQCTWFKKVPWDLQLMDEHLSDENVEIIKKAVF
jgi:tRNA dimethylallyltransferase